MDSLKDQLSVSRPLSPSYNIKNILWYKWQEDPLDPRDLHVSKGQWEVCNEGIVLLCGSARLFLV